MGELKPTTCTFRNTADLINIIKIAPQIAESDRIAEEMVAWAPSSPSKRKISGVGGILS